MTEDDYTWEHGTFKIWEYKICSHGFRTDSRVTEFGERFARKLIGAELFILGVAAFSGTSPITTFGLGVAAAPIVYLASSDLLRDTHEDREE